MAYFMAFKLPEAAWALKKSDSHQALSYPLSWSPAYFSAIKLSGGVILQTYVGSGQLSGVVCDKLGNTITGIQCDVRVFDKTTFQLIGQVKSNSSNGQWSLSNIAPKGLKVLAVFSYEGTYLGDTDIAGAEYLSYS